MNQAGIDLLREYEGWRSHAYLDIVGVPTIGFGFTDGVKMGDFMTPADGEVRLKQEVAKYQKAVARACNVEPSDNQLAAMTCFSFNIGVAGFVKSTVLKAHNRGDDQSAARAFGLWDKAGGKVVVGLTRRRAAEAALYLKPAPSTPVEMPQRVEPERPITRSPMQLAGTGTAVASAMSVGAQVAGDVSSIRDSLGNWLPTIIMIAALVGVALGAYVVWQRWRQRHLGWS